MREHPVFVPWNEEHLAAIVTVPDEQPRGLVALVPGGGGAPRSHRFALWTRTARALADRGIASVRMDWKGVGDSTGSPLFSFRALPVEEAAAVIEFAQEATGIEDVGVVGNCLGARTAMQLAPSIPGCRSLVLMLLKPLAGTRRKTGLAPKVKSAVKRVPGMAKQARRLYWKLKGRKADPIMQQLRAVALTSDLLLMETLSGEKTGKLPTMVAKFQREGTGHRLELRDLPGGTARAFQSIERQAYVIDSIVEWFDQTFAPAPKRKAAAEAGVAGRGVTGPRTDPVA